MKLACKFDGKGSRRYMRNDALPYKIYSFKGRTLDLKRPVKVYRNLNRKGVWFSVCQDGRVVGHAQGLMLGDAKFHVNEAGRQRVIATGRKNVHAWVWGTLTGSGMGTCLDRRPDGVKIEYSPRKSPDFRWKSGAAGMEHRVKGAMIVMLRAEGVFGYYTH